MRSRLGYGFLFLAISIPCFAWPSCKLSVVFDHAPKAPRDFSGLLHKAEAGHFNAQFRVGLPYESGVGIEQDYDEAARWYQTADRCTFKSLFVRYDTLPLRLAGSFGNFPLHNPLGYPYEDVS